MTTGGPSTSFEMIILRNKSHGEVIRVCLRVFSYVVNLEMDNSLKWVFNKVSGQITSNAL